MIKRHSSSKKKSKTQPKSKNSTVRIAVLALATLGLVIFISLAIQFIQSLGQPITKGLQPAKLYSWNGHSSINIAFKSDKIHILNYDPENQTAIILNVPGDLEVDVPKGYGSWPIGSVYELGKSEKPAIGAWLLELSLSKMLGLPIDGYISLENYQKETPETMLKALKGNPIATLSYLKNIKTDLTPKEAFKLMTSLASVRSDNITTLDLADTDITESKLLPDSSRVLGVNNVALDTFIRDNMIDKTIAKENLDIAIFNATNHPGLAFQVSREITNLGGNVISVTNTENILDKSLVLTATPSKTFTRLAEIYAPRCLNNECAVSDPKINQSRAQINIVLGEDYYQLYNER